MKWEEARQKFKFMDLEKKYHAKLMLAGEYGVIAGSEAITIPLKLFSSRLAHLDKNTVEKKFFASVTGLRKLVSYIEGLPRNSFFARPGISELNQLLKKDFYIESSIPEGYGVGSSGAVSALIYDQFFEGHSSLSLQEQHKDLATLESCFHGKSSGVDAMTCYSDQALHFLPGGEIRKVESNPVEPRGGYRFFLLDSEQVYETGPLVNYFLEQMKDPAFRERMQKEYALLIRKMIGILDQRMEGDPALVFRAISDFQWTNLRRMIPENVEMAWINGQVSSSYYLKLNGSGGGFLLGIAARESVEEVEAMLADFKIIWI
jgi:mevalonate kinase